MADPLASDTTEADICRMYSFNPEKLDAIQQQNKYAQWDEEGKRLAYVQRVKNLWGRIYKYTPAPSHLKLEEQLAEVKGNARVYPTPFVAITLNPKPSVARNPDLWNKFLYWVGNIAYRPYAKPDDFEYQIELRPKKGLESRHIHLILRLKYCRSPSTIRDSLCRNKFFDANEHNADNLVYVRPVTDRATWLQYMRKDLKGTINSIYVHAGNRDCLSKNKAEEKKVAQNRAVKKASRCRPADSDDTSQ